MGQEYLDSLDVANQTCQLCGVEQIASVTEDSRNNKEISFAYGKARRAELRRNTWVFSIRKAVLRPIDNATMILSPAPWSATTTYVFGAIVSDGNKQLWLSLQKQNLNNVPGGNDNAWTAYFGPRSIEPWDTTDTTTYWAGELVYMAGSVPGSYTIFQSLISNNADTPNVATAWSATTTYDDTSIVSYSGSQWLSLIPLNLNNAPASGPAFWLAATTYATGNTVTGSDFYQYTSVGNGNLGNDPTLDNGTNWTKTTTITFWEAAPTSAVSSMNWLPIAATMTKDAVNYPLGSGPASQMATRNAYMLPSGFLNYAPQDPKAGSMSFLGAPSGMQYSQWNVEGDYIVSEIDSKPMVLRFVADITRVKDMEDMFCRGLAATIATAVCEILTQSDAKLQSIAREYKLWMGEARAVNMIEMGPVEPPEDDYITCRM
jgi:hypothetical protein